MWTPLLALALQSAPVPAAPTEAAQAAPAEIAAPLVIVPRAWLALDAVDRRGRRPFRPDAVFAKHLLVRSAAPPAAGETLVGETGETKTWTEREADENGRLTGSFGYAYTALESDAERVLLANLQGAGTLFVNGAGFQGDMYGYGFGGVPVLLREGVNHVYVTGIRGGFALRFTRPETRIVIGTWDVTKPDLFIGDMVTINHSHSGDEVAVLVLNASVDPVKKLHLHYGHVPSTGTESAGVGDWKDGTMLIPLGLAKPWMPSTDFRFEMEPPPRSVPFLVEAFATEEEVHAKVEIPIDVRPQESAGRHIFESAIDGSLQQYSVLPPTRPLEATGTVLSLHGAGVDALNQARSYGAKDDLWIVAPTNRRPFGFDWQDWGRADAYEVLADARHGRGPVFLTGHSMGGHGVWHLAANDPDRFAAIAPSAGWRSFDTYGGRPDSELRELWHAADGTSLTESLLANLVSLPTFILHGEADDNVPASEAHAMEKLLKEAGGEPEAHYQEGAGHWWDGGAAPGADCVDWPGIFELFSKAQPTQDVPLELDWISVDPAVDARHHGVAVEQPLVYGMPFRVRTRIDDERSALVVETENVRRLFLQHPAKTLERYVVDGQELSLRSTVLERRGERWSEAAIEPTPGEKSPRRSGPFKRAFDNRFVFVYGTLGDDAGDRELFERARSDQEQWWYRANAAPQVVPDSLPGPWSESRNAILYGNAQTNAAWDRLVPGSCPVRVREGAIELGERTFEGDDLACVFVYPRADDASHRALVGAFGSTGVAGARLGYVLAPFVSGVGYPDYVIFSSKILAEGDGGVLAAGWFDREWQLQPGGFVRE